MSRINPYASIEKRTFQAAVIHLLETEYRIVGSHRILKVLAEDIEALVAQFYPKAERLHSGDLIWTCTGDEGQKAQPGKPPRHTRRSRWCCRCWGRRNCTSMSRLVAESKPRRACKSASNAKSHAWSRRRPRKAGY